MSAGIVFLDYVLAFTMLGLSGIFNKVFRDERKPTAVVVGVIVTFFLRFLCLLLSGAWIWDVWMPEEFMNMPMTNPWIYSALYNGSYMLAETVSHCAVAMVLYDTLRGQFFIVNR